MNSLKNRFEELCPPGSNYDRYIAYMAYGSKAENRKTIDALDNFCYRTKPLSYSTPFARRFTLQTLQTQYIVGSFAAAFAKYCK